jgi:hypothetical protein
VAKCLKDNIVKILKWQSQSPDLRPTNWLSYTTSVRRNVPKFTQLILTSLWKATQNIWTQVKQIKVNATKY